jgi:hypothetical protein
VLIQGCSSFGDRTKNNNVCGKEIWIMKALLGSLVALALVAGNVSSVMAQAARPAALAKVHSVSEINGIVSRSLEANPAFNKLSPSEKFTLVQELSRKFEGRRISSEQMGREALALAPQVSSAYSNAMKAAETQAHSSQGSAADRITSVSACYDTPVSAPVSLVGASGVDVLATVAEATTVRADIITQINSSRDLNAEQRTEALEFVNANGADLAFVQGYNKLFALRNQPDDAVILLFDAVESGLAIQDVNARKKEACKAVTDFCQKCAGGVGMSGSACSISAAKKCA